MKLFCPQDGGHIVSAGSQPGEQYCPTHQIRIYQARKEPKQRPKASKPNGPSVTFKLARRRFKAIVCSRRCFFADTKDTGEPRRPGHECSYPLDGHHLVDQQFIKDNFGDLPEDEFLEILFNPVIGAPLCRYSGHACVESRLTSFIYWDELEDDCIEFCERIDERYADVPHGPTGSKRKSMFERLKERCPEREQVAA